jgi:phosphoadenosine phosphosulfate reductase
VQITLEGKTKEQVAIERLQQYEPPEGYYLAFSGGKDSMCIYHLAVQANVKFDAHYSVTGIDPPELVQFIKKQYPDVQRHLPKMSIWKYIEKKGLPTRTNRWCCQVLKETGGKDRVVVIGIRAEESNKRSHRPLYEVRKHKTILNPILDWSLLDVWDYIDNHELPYCTLYDNYADRLGCVGCPMSTRQEYGFKMYPKIKDAWFRATVRYFENNASKKASRFTSAEQLWQWWLQDKSMDTFLKQNQTAMELKI